MKYPYERCMEVCNEKGACQHPSGCMAQITQDEMFAMFGKTMPIEASQLIWEAPDNMTIGEIRAKLRELVRGQG